MNRNIIFSFLLITAFAGCSTLAPRGVVDRRLSEDEARVRLAKHEAKEGKAITLYRNVCTESTYKPGISVCEYKKIGKGEITQVEGDRFAVVRFGTGVDFNEGDRVRTGKY